MWTLCQLSSARSANGKGMTSTAPCATVVEEETYQAETGSVLTEKGKIYELDSYLYHSSSTFLLIHTYVELESRL